MNLKTLALQAALTVWVANLWAQLPPTITTQPTNQIIMAGATATFNVEVSGTEPFTYQWQLNGTNLPNGMITTVAGNGTNGYSGDGGAATNASLYYPYGIAVDASGNLFIADYNNNRIRKVNPNGIIMTVAGNGSRAYSGDNGAAINASLNSPFGVGLDASGNLFIADTDDNRIREVVLFGSYPTLTLHNITTKNAGNYTVIITSPYGSITSSIVTLTVVVRPAISGMVPNLDGSATLSFSGGAGETYLVQAATNLMPPVVWQTLSTNVAGTNGTWQFTDAGATNCPMRFYRARTP